MSRTLVTGATGFIGRRLVGRLLSEQEQVVVLVRTEAQAASFESLGCTAHVGDLMDPSTLKGLPDVDQVVHLAGHASLDERNPDILAVNTIGTGNLLDAVAPSKNLKRFILMSSITALARDRGNRLRKPVDLSCTATPDTLYGRSKREAEECVVRKLETTDLDWTILRPALVYGPGSRPQGGMNALIRHATSTLVGRLNLPGRVSVIHVDDLVDLCLLALGGKLTRRSALLVADGDPVTFGDVFRTTARLLGKPRKLAPVTLVCGAARTGYDLLDASIGISRWIPSYLLAPFGASLACESGDLQSTGFKPRYTLESGLIQTLRN